MNRVPFVPNEPVRLASDADHMVAHRVADIYRDAVRTECGWLTRGGVVVPARHARERHALFCIRCWTPR